jgi:hypothetical protein
MTQGQSDTLKKWKRMGSSSWRDICIGIPEDYTIFRARMQQDFCRTRMAESPDAKEFYQWQIDMIEGAVTRGEVHG